MDLVQATQDLQRLLYDADITIYTLSLRRQAKRGIERHTTPLIGTAALNQYKQNVKRGMFRFNPGRELRIINALRDHTDSLNRKNIKYLERRYRRTFNRLHHPSPYHRIRGSKGGFIEPCHLTHYEGFQVAGKLLDVLSQH